jgi:hypothetical protein
LLLDWPTGTDESNPTVRLFAAKFFGNGDAGGKMPTRAASGKHVQRWSGFSLIAQ